MNENKRILSFEDVKNSEIDIFGEKFEVNFSEEYINRLKALNIEDISNKEVFAQLKMMLNLVLSDEKAYDKIATTYKDHENKEFGTQTFIKVMTFIFNEYSKEIASIKGTDFGSKNLYANKNKNQNYRGYNNSYNGYNKGYNRGH